MLLGMNCHSRKFNLMNFIWECEIPNSLKRLNWLMSESLMKCMLSCFLFPVLFYLVCDMCYFFTSPKSYPFVWQGQSFLAGFSSSSPSSVWKLGTGDSYQVWSGQGYLCYGMYNVVMMDYSQPILDLMDVYFSPQFLFLKFKKSYLQCHHGVRSLQVSKWLQTQVKFLFCLL